MTFERGHPKYAGRQVGTVNKSKLLELIDERFPGFHPILAMIEMFRDTENPPEVRARLLSEITTYTVLRLKPIDPMEARRLSGEAVIDARSLSDLGSKAQLPSSRDRKNDPLALKRLTRGRFSPSQRF